MSALQSRQHTLTEPAMSVLVVDAYWDTRNMYAEYLRSLGYHVEMAEDGRVALAKVLSRRPSLIVTDAHLPGLTGIELCRLVRVDDVTKSTPVIVITSAGSLTRDAEAAGANAVLVKPCLPDVLEAEIRRVVSETPGPAEIRTAPRPPAGEKASSARRRVAMNRVHVRLRSSTPPIPPPALVCQRCDQPLVYVNSYVGGVTAKRTEQWDYFECRSGCGVFQYRHRSRQLRSLPPAT